MRRTVAIAAVALLGALSVLPATAAGGASPGKVKPVLQPGQFYRPNFAGGCTLGFLYGGSDGYRYFTTAAHCVAAQPSAVTSSGETVFDNPPEQRRPDGSVFGHAVYAVNDYKIGVPRTPGPTPGADFALIRVLENVRTSPAMCHWGGPTRQNDDVHDRPVLTRFYGYGNVIGQVRPLPPSLTPPGLPQPVVAPARSGASHGLPDRYYAYTSFATLNGDSGGPVMTADGGAVGVINLGGAEVAADRATAGAGTVYITRLGPVIERAEQMLGIELRLKTAPLSGADGPVGTTACPSTS